MRGGPPGRSPITRPTLGGAVHEARIRLLRGSFGHAQMIGVRLRTPPGGAHPPPKEPRSGNGTVVSTCTGWDHGRGGVVGPGRGPGSLVVACGWLVRPPGAVRSPPGLLVGRSPSQDETERSHDRPHEREDREPEPNGLEGLADVRIIEATYRSAIERRPIQIASVRKAERPDMSQAMRCPPVKKPRLVDVESASGER